MGSSPHTGRRRALAGLSLIVALFVCMPLEAKPPPVEFALEAVGEGAERRAGFSWSMTRVGDGLEQLCGESQSEDDGVVFRFTGDGADVQVGPDAQAPWDLLWAVLWAGEPTDVLGGELDDWTDETARVEVADGAPVNCWGDESRLCVDELNRRVEVLELEVGETTWGIYTLRDGTRVQISRDGAQFARLIQGGC